MREVLVVGGGAAGMMAAITAAGEGASVRLFEQNEKLGKKVYITGKGRCNFTNACPPGELHEHIVSNPRFLFSAFSSFNNLDTVAFFEKLGLPAKVERGERVFLLSDKSSDMIRVLENELHEKGVVVHKDSAVKEIRFETGIAETGATTERRVAGILTADGNEVFADAVIVATGGLSYPSTGATGDGFRFAAAAGHAVTPTRPALVPLLVRESYARSLQGLSLRNVRLCVRDNKKELFSGFGEMLFTEEGISGPLVLQASSVVGAALELGELKAAIDLKPALSAEKLDARMLRELEAAPKKEIKNIIPSLYPASLRPVILALSGIDPEKRGAEVSRQERRTLLELTKEFPLTITGAGGYREAVITQGGVDLRGVDPRTMESKLVRGLYFAGEVLDLDAYTGGFNLQSAWSTGFVAGREAAREEN